MANTGRFIDRSPLKHAAGKSTGVPEQTVSSSMKDNAEDDAIDTLEQEVEIGTEDVSVPPSELPAITNPSFAKTNSKRYDEQMEKEVWDDQVGPQYYRKGDDCNPSEQLDKGSDRHFKARSGMDPHGPAQEEARHVHQEGAGQVHQKGAGQVHQKGARYERE